LSANEKYETNCGRIRTLPEDLGSNVIEFFLTTIVQRSL